VNYWATLKRGILFHNLLEFVHPDDRESTFIEMNKLERGEAVYEFENRFLNKMEKLFG
jgi:hypothetical protein